MNKNYDKVILIILDGLGISPVEDGNAVLKAKTPIFDCLLQNFPKTLLHASGEEVGLPWGEMGNSEVGHLNLGTGRISMQDLPRINKTIENRSFFSNQYLIDACNHVKKNRSTLHLVGLLSDGGVHSHIDHLLALLELAKMENVSQVAIHAITDGRDLPPKDTARLFKKLQEKIEELKTGKIASIVGRFYAMDRDKNWDRIKIAYNLITSGEEEIAQDWQSALDSHYQKGEDDEKLTPILLDKNLIISDNDAVIFYNFRQDRAKQISQALLDKDFKGFTRTKFPKNLRFISFVSYGNEQSPLIDVAYMSEQINHQSAMIVSESGLDQFHIAETEKYAHVTYFFNGGVEKAFAGEQRIIIPSPKVKSYDQKPEMSAGKITEEFLKYFKRHSPYFSLINYANPDMVGHTGNLNAAIRAVETVDVCLGKILSQLSPLNSHILLTADHGNCEQMINPETKDIDKEHTTNPIPLVMISQGTNIKNIFSQKITLADKLAFFSSQPTGVLADLSPTVLDFIGLKKPEEMTGMSLKEAI